MTGYGLCRTSIDQLQYLTEVKTLNSRTPDIRIKLPSSFRELEPEIRKLIQQTTVRGKVDFSISLEGASTEEHYSLNHKMLQDYHTQLQEFAKSRGINFSDPITSLVRLPNIYSATQLQLDDRLRESLLGSTRQALELLQEYRKTEGEATYHFLDGQIKKIKELKLEADKLDPHRIEKIRSRIHKNLKSLGNELTVDQNRLEQELIYYIEKIDYSEESQRLDQHCDYFEQVLHNQDETKGRKLNFISQEIGREINTMGSKAQDAPVQKVVVNMKDELEKIKEQLANIL